MSGTKDQPEAASRSGEPILPPHVDPRLVHSLSPYEQPNDAVDPFRQGDAIRNELPPVFFTQSVTGGLVPQSWVVTSYEDIRRVYQTNDLYSTYGAAAFHWLIGETFPMLPLGADPPDHTRYRIFLNPWFVPKAVKDLEVQMSETINELIDNFVDRGEVDIAYEFSRIYPVRVFLNLMGFPQKSLEEFLDWGYAILHSQGDLEKVKWGISSAIGYIRDFNDTLRKSPNDSLASYIVNGEIKGEKLTDNEIMGMMSFIWLGGLDTVAATSALMFRRLSMQPELQRTLRANPDLIPNAVEEFLRVQPLVNSSRLVREDHEIRGVQIKKGDHICCFNNAGNFDPESFENPREIRFDRDRNRHWTLAGGSHLCLGAHLARRELRIALSSVLDRLPEFRPKPGADLTAHPGLIAIPHMPIVWD